MKYFTPELYLQGQSLDDDVLDRTEEEWERRIKRYRRHYKKIEVRLPAALRRFHDEQCLHDAEWCGLARLPVHVFPSDSQEVTIIARQENTLIPEFLHTLAILHYTATAEPVVEKPRDSAFQEIHPIWLYDEIDVVSPGVFSHSILVSNGLVVTIHFREFRYYIAPLLDPSLNGAADEAQPVPARKSTSA